MEKKPDSKVPVIRFKSHSEAWRKASVSSLLNERDIQAPKSEQYPLMAFIAGQGVAPKGKRYDRASLVSDEVNKKYKQTELGDFIYSSNNLETGSIGLNNYGSASISPVYSIFSPSLDSDSYFIGQLLCRKTVVNEMVRWRQGVVYGQWRIHERDFLGIETTFPSASEQTLIGAYFKELDRLIGLHQRKQEKLLTLKQAMLQKMFPQPGATTPEIRFRDFNGEWEEAQLGEIMTITSAARVHKNEWTKSGVPFFRTSDVVARFRGEENEKVYISVELFEKLSDKIGRIKRGDILITGGGSIGIPFLVETDDPLYFKDADLLWLKVPENIDSVYLNAFFSSGCFRKFLKSISHIGTIGHYTVEQAKMTPIKMPLKAEQQKIGAYFRQLDALIVQHATQLDKLKNIKAACLERLFV